MGVLEKGPLGSQAINVRGFDQRMAPQATDPIILVIDGNKQNIRFVRSLQNVRQGQ
jgi:hypothetical protein